MKDKAPKKKTAAAKSSPSDRARFEMFTDKSGKPRWNLRSGNGKVVGDSGESYSRMRDTRRAIARYRRLVASATVVNIDDEKKLEALTKKATKTFKAVMRTRRFVGTDQNPKFQKAAKKALRRRAK